MNKELRLAVRQAACEKCKLHTQADGLDQCRTGDGPNGADIMVVTKFPTVADSRTRRELTEYLEEAGIDPDRVMWCSALKCRVWDMDPSKTDMKACRPYLEAETAFIKPGYVLAVGSEALFATTGKSGIMKYRGKVFTHGETQMFATISPAMVGRNPGLRGGFVADLMYFKRLADGGSTATPKHHTPGDRRTYVVSKDALRAMLTALRTAGVVAYDIETVGASEFATDAAIVSVAFTVIPADSTADDPMDDAHVYELPLWHPGSVWRKQWRAIVRLVYNALRRAKKRIAHNAKFDTRWLIHFGHVAGDYLMPTYDTIIALALLDENAPKGLKPAAQQRLGADPWGVDTRDLLNMAIEDVLEYNGLDTWHTLRMYFHTKPQLASHPRTLRLFVHLMMPTVQELILAERKGVYVHRHKLMDNWAATQGRLQAVNELLLSQLNEDDVPERFHKRDGSIDVNFNPSHFARWFIFEYLGLPILARGKTKDNGQAGDPSMAEAVMMELRDAEEDRLQSGDPTPPTLNVPALLLERAGYVKMCNGFYEPYSEQMDDAGRIHTTFKPWGTVTGRMSSGGEDAEKMTGRRSIRGVNLQQVPRNPLVRGVFGAPPGSSFVEADYSQIELRLAAFLAREPTMLHLYATGQDIHMAMAMRMTGKAMSQVTKEERKRAKAVNFGFLYGMGWVKFIATAWLNYGLRVTEDESRAFRKAFFGQFDKLPSWHAKQRRLAAKYGRVETPMGRVRHLPDIYSPDEGVRAEAERQAINSPVQGFASDMALLSATIIARKFRERGINGHVIGMVHDAVNFEIENPSLPRALPIIKHTMENLPLQRLFGIHLDVPIVADLKAGDSWGEAHEIPAEMFEDRTALRGWIKENVA